jgi:uroporphyrinogen-III synthase
MESKTLSHLHIALTREREANEPLAVTLYERGATVYHCPLIRIAPPLNPTEFDAAVKALRRYDWLVFTSAHAVRAVLSRRSIPDRVRVACVGVATANEVLKSHENVTLAPTEASSKALADALAHVGVANARILWPRSEIAEARLKIDLEALGARVDAPVAYRNVPDHGGGTLLATLLSNHTLNAIAFASGSAVKYAIAAAGERLGSVRLYSIGPSTSLVLTTAGLKIAGEATDHSAAGLAQAILAGESNRE